MTGEERKQKEEKLRKELENPFRKWLNEDVAYIITDAERATLKRLQTNEEREHFVEQFWLRRDPTPDTVENEFKEEHYRRIAYSNEHFAAAIPGWKTDRGRIYITYGPPDEKETHPSPVPSEQWRYHLIAGIGANIVVEFTDPNRTGEYRMTADPAMLRAPDEMPVPSAGTPTAGATVKAKGQGVSISVPLTACGDHRVEVYTRVVIKAMTYSGPVPPPPPVQVFKASIQCPAPYISSEIPLPNGSYTFEIVVKDMVTGKLAADTIEIEVE